MVTNDSTTVHVYCMKMIQLFWILVIMHLKTGSSLNNIHDNNQNLSHTHEGLVRNNDSIDWLDIGDELCPFRDQCTRSLTNPATHAAVNINGSLCQPCECSSQCWTTNCCTGIPVEAATCRDQSALFNDPRGLQYTDTNSYYIIETCAESFKDDAVINACRNPTGILNFVFVSDKTGRIYKNSACARCNHVEEYMYWDLVVPVNRNLLEYNIYNLTETIMSEIPVHSRPPTSLPRSQLHTYRCFPKSISSCNETGDWDQYDARLVELCHNSSTSFYFGDFFGLPVLYKNVYCFLCNQKLNSTREHTGSRFFLEGILNGDEMSTDLKIVFNVSQLESFHDNVSANNSCKVNEIFDPFMEICRSLFCPVGSVATFGVCDFLMYRVEGLQMKIVFEVKSAQFMDLSKGRRLHFRNMYDGIINGFNITAFTKICKVCKTIYYQHDSSLNTFVEMTFETSNECKQKLIKEFVYQLANITNVLLSFQYDFREVRFQANLIDTFNYTDAPVVFSKRISATACLDEAVTVNKNSATDDGRIMLTDSDLEMLNKTFGANIAERLFEMKGVQDGYGNTHVLLKEYLAIIKPDDEVKEFMVPSGSSFLSVDNALFIPVLSGILYGRFS